MSSYADLSVDGEVIRTYRNGISDELLAIFNTCDINDFQGKEGATLARSLGLDDYAELCEDDDGAYFVVLRQKAGILKRRLSIYGFGQETFFKEFRLAVKETIERARHLLDKYPSQDSKEKVRFLNEIYNSGADVGIDDIISNKYSLACMEDCLDDCNLLYGHICNCDDEQNIFLNISELIDDWIDDDAFDKGSYSMPNPLIITEGVNDLYVLKKSLAILYPELIDNISFLDTSFKPEGGTGPIIKMVKSFASAHISNRILAVLDNDSAASAALLGLKDFPLPKNIRVIQYPPIKLLEAYPTIGPQGESVMDINGLAGSIEMYLGQTALHDKHGALEKIQWKGFIPGVDRYQGALINKERVNQNFKKVIKRSNGKNDLEMQIELKDLRFVWDYIISELETVGWVQEPLVGSWA